MKPNSQPNRIEVLGSDLDQVISSLFLALPRIGNDYIDDVACINRRAFGYDLNNNRLFGLSDGMNAGREGPMAGSPVAHNSRRAGAIGYS